MKSVLVTGATGFLGKSLVMRLAGEGQKVNALYRSEDKIRGWSHENIHFVKGNLGDIKSIDQAMKGCAQVYHLAALASPWSKIPETFYRENVAGTENILDSALRHGIDRVVFTSTAGVLGPSVKTLNTEEKQFRGDHFTHYDSSKVLAESKVKEYIEKGLEVVIVNPSRIYGPGVLSRSNAVTYMINSFLRGRWRIIPGNGSSIGNYVYVDDVVDCHIRAMAKGRSGERYLAGGDNLSFNDFFLTLARISGKSHRMFHMPMGLMMITARGMEFTANLTGFSPRITPDFVRRYNHNWALSSEKAKQELGYRPIPIEEGLKKTIEWIKN